MKTNLIIGLCMALVLLGGTAVAEWDVTWTPVKESIIDKEYIIEVQNMQPVKRDVNLSSFFAETSFDISKLSDVEFYEWDVVPYTYTVDHYDEVGHSEYNSVNGTWNNWTEQVYSWTESIESTKLDWEECKAQLFTEDGTTKEDNYGFINIPKFGSEHDGDGTYNGTKIFKLTFRTPVVYDGTYGSVGKVALLLDGEEHHPYWNTSWSSRQDIILTGGTSGAQTDYQILLNISWATGMQADFDDLRMCNDTHEIDSWLESKVDSSYALVWAEFPTTPANAVDQMYYLYYGNDAAANYWDGNAAFILFDDFLSSAYDTNDWTARGSPSLSYPDSTTIRITRPSATWTANGYGLHSQSVMSDQIAFRRKATAGEEYCMGFWFSSGNYVRFYHYTGANDCRWSRWVGGSESVGATGLTNFPTGTVEITRTGQSYNYTVDGTSLWSGSITNFSGNANVQMDQAVSAVSSDTDWALVRKYTANPPTATLSSTKYYVDSIHYNNNTPYNHTIESDGTITANRTITASDDINWTAVAVSDDCQFVVTEYNLSCATIANFALYNSSIDWLKVTNLTTSTQYNLQFANGTLVETHDADANGNINFTTNLAPNDYRIVLGHAPATITLHSSYPDIIQTNHTGTIQVNYIVESIYPLNLSTLAVLYGINYTTTGDMHSYIAAPPNSIASEGIYRAPYRNTTPYLSWENNATITGGNVWQWAGGDNDSAWITKTPINASHTWINATGYPEHIFQGSFYLGRRAMDTAPKTGFNVNSQQGLIIKMWDNEAIRGRTVDYIINMYFDSDWQSTIPTSPIEIWGLNSSFNPDTDNPTISEFGAKIVEWDGNRWINHSWEPDSNASYSYPLVLDASTFPVIPDEINYIYLKSGTQSSKSYVLNATNHDPGICNITYAQTETMWTYSELADVSTQVAYTPSFFTTFVRDDEQFLHHLYIANDQGAWTHSDINNISIGVSHYPVAAPSFEYFNITCPTGYLHDTRMDATYNGGAVYVGIYCHADPDGGTVSHNLTIHYTNGTIAGIINDTFTTTTPGTVEINFTTSTYYSATDAYILKCISTDDENSVATVWLDSFFTLAADGTQGYYVDDYLMFWGMNDIPTLYATIANNSLISYDAGSDIYTMHVPFFKSKCNETFRFNETVHLKSINTEDIVYFRFHGETIFDNANVYGWNTVSDTAAPTSDAYRAYMIAYGLTTGNITNSDLSYLGSDIYRQEGLNFIDNTMEYLIYNTTLSHNSRGIIMEECENFNISHCNIHDNEETGIGVYYSDNAVVENCTISDSAYDPGLYLYETSDNIIRHNIITDCVDYGMRVRSNSNNNMIIGNDITGSGIYDYYFSSAAINNTIQDAASTTDKIRVTSTSEVNIENTDNAAFSEDSSNSTYAYPTNFSMSVTGVSQTFDITPRDITITPNTDSIRVWNLEWNHIVKFNASDVSGSPYAWFNITHPPWAYSNISIYRNDTIYFNTTADASGHVAYNYSGGWSEHWFEFSPENIAPDKPTLVIPANGATGTSTNPTLQVMVTDYNADLLDVTFYTQGGTQIGSTQTGITNGSTASVVWSGRSYSTTYYWYAVAHDGKAPSQHDTWNFRTQGSGSGSSHVIDITGCTDWSGNARHQVYIDFGCTGETAGATFTTNATNGSIDSSTGIYTWNTASADAGVYNWRFNVENVYSVSDYCDVTITVYHFASPTNLAATTGNFWANHTWDGNGFTDSYNVSVNDVWTNGSADQYSYHVRYPHAWSNISVAAFNDTTGLSSFISSDVQVPNNAIVLTNYTALMLATAGDNVTVDLNHEDLDGDTATYYCSRMDLFTDFSTADGTGQYTNAVNGTHEVIFGATDGYGWSNQTITIEVGAVHPLELDEETPLILFVVLVVLLFGSLFYIYHAASYVAKIVTALISTWMSFMLSNMAVSGNVVLNYAELSAGDVFIYGAHSIQIAALSHFFMFTGVVSALFMLVFAIKLVIDTYLDMQAKRKEEEEWDGVE